MQRCPGNLSPENCSYRIVGSVGRIVIYRNQTGSRQLLEYVFCLNIDLLLQADLYCSQQSKKTILCSA